MNLRLLTHMAKSPPRQRTPVFSEAGAPKSCVRRVRAHSVRNAPRMRKPREDRKRCCFHICWASGRPLLSLSPPQPTPALFQGINVYYRKSLLFILYIYFVRPRQRLFTWELERHCVFLGVQHAQLCTDFVLWVPS